MNVLATQARERALSVDARGRRGAAADRGGADQRRARSRGGASCGWTLLCRPPCTGSSQPARRRTREGLRRRLRRRRLALRREPRPARRRRGLGLRPLRGARRRDQPRRAAAQRCRRGAGATDGDLGPGRASGLRLRHRGDEGDAHRGRGRGDGGRVRGRVRRDRPERPGQRGSDCKTRRAGDSRARPSPPGSCSSPATSSGTSRATRRSGRSSRARLLSRRSSASPRRAPGPECRRQAVRGRARPAVAEGDLQRGHESGRRAHAPDARPRLRGPRAAAARQRPGGRGQGRRGGAGDRARRRSRRT